MYTQPSTWNSTCGVMLFCHVSKILMYIFWRSNLESKSTYLLCLELWTTSHDLHSANGVWSVVIEWPTYWMSLASDMNVIFDLSLAVLDIHNLFGLLDKWSLDCIVFSKDKLVNSSFTAWWDTTKTPSKVILYWFSTARQVLPANTLQSESFLWSFLRAEVTLADTQFFGLHPQLG